MTVNTKLQQDGEGEFPKAHSAFAHAGRSMQELQNETSFVGVFSLDGGPSLGLTQIYSILIKCLKSVPRAYLDCNVEYTNQTDETRPHLRRP